VDVPAATRHGVVLTITCGANHDTVAEHAFSLLLALAKYVTVTDRQMRQGLWIRDVTIPIRGRVMGIVGLGRIGQAMALRSLAFGMKVIASDVQPNADFVRKHGIEVVELPELLKRSDVVSLHAPMGSATKHLINKQTLALMKPTAFLINTARGGLIDEEALVEALQKRKIAGAGLDVFAQEPPPTNHAFFKLDNVVMTPHLGGTDVQSRLDMAELAARSVVELASGRWPEALIVNHDVKSKFRWLKAN
jgi:phosphoglycerate dehydrogenase-like enzyme